MKMFLFRLSRLFSILTFVTIFLLIIIFFRDCDIFEEYMVTLFGMFLVSIPIIIFNWLCFGKPTLWIKNPNTENIE
jgi:hypothetical protein